tara:strand:+ start:862 stop:1491 length:630 start_codon:yes stop_codon:yes gene_type:complete
MSEKVDFKKTQKHLYKPSAKQPVIVDVPELSYIMIEGVGAPDQEAFQNSVKALYNIAYKIRMSHKKGLEPEGYFEFVVPPLEGIWDVVEGTDYNVHDKSNFKWKLMIRQPDFVTEAFVNEMKQMAISKDDNTYLNKVYFCKQADGLSCQMMHIGPFDKEPETFEKMEEWSVNQGYKRIYKTHREIYLSDYNKVAPEKLKTVLRFKVEKA